MQAAEQQQPGGGYIAAAECDALGVKPATVWQWASRGLVIDGERRTLNARALDGRGRPLYFRDDVITFRDSRRASLAKRVTGCQAPNQATYAQNRPGALTAAGSNHVRTLSLVTSEEAVMVASEPAGVTIPVRLDLTEAERQLDRFCAKIRRDLAKAVAAGLAVRGLTVHMDGRDDAP